MKYLIELIVVATLASLAVPCVADSEQFRLKLYWEDGYFWQDKVEERDWCLECKNGRCGRGRPLEVRDCGPDSLYFSFRNLEDETTSIQLAGTNLCLQLVDSKKIELRKCDDDRQRQKFSSGPGSFKGEKFELQPISSPGCLTQHHHPAKGEVIFKETCKKSRNHNTSYWVKF